MTLAGRLRVCRLRLPRTSAPSDLMSRFTVDDQFAYLQFLSDTAHNASLGVALKNGPDMITNRPAIVDITDFAIIGQCSAFDECDTYTPFVQAGKAAFEVE